MNPRQLPALKARAQAFLCRLSWFRQLTGGWFQAVRLILAVKLGGDATQTVIVNERRIRFRGKDEQALREVLVDNEYAFLEPSLRMLEAPRILDIGAHIGTFAIWCLERNPRAQILSLEADPDTAALTRSNAAGAGAWSVRHGAAGARDGDIVHLCVSGPSMSHRVGLDSGGVPVTSVSLTTLLDVLAMPGGQIDLMKVDIEGSEQAFLCADPSQLARVGALVVELHPGLCDAKRVEASLEEAFDSVVHIGGRVSTKPLLYCTRRGAPIA